MDARAPDLDARRRPPRAARSRSPTRSGAPATRSCSPRRSPPSRGSSSAGLAYLSYADPLEHHLVPHWEAARVAVPEEANDIVVRQIFGGVRARAALSGVELAIDAWRPHVVLRESCEFAGAIAAESRADPARAGGRRAGADRGLRDPHRGPDGRRAAGVGRARARPGGPQARRDALPHADPAGARGAGRPAARAHPALPRRRGAAAPGAGPGRAAARLRDVRHGGGRRSGSSRASTAR